MRYDVSMEGPAYLLIDNHGRVIGLAKERDDAVSMAHEATDGFIFLDAPTEEDYQEVTSMAANPSRVPSRISDAPEDSLSAIMKAIGRQEIDFEAAMRMSEEEAHSLMVPYFPTTRPREGKIIPATAYKTPRSMKRSILGQNYKTAKETPDDIVDTLFEETGFRKALVMGLSILPTTQGYKNDYVNSLLSRASELFGMKRSARVRVNVCRRATVQCASSCLVFSGQNRSDRYNTIKKFALLSSLVNQPEAFVRMLVASIESHVCDTACENEMPLVRLNVFSDLPWELMVPGLFERFPEVQFYDYTKIPNRKPPENYDLTFSFAGTKKNVEDMDYEVTKMKRRVAVVFAATSMKVLHRTQWIDEYGVPHVKMLGESTAKKRAKKYGGTQERSGKIQIPRRPDYLTYPPGVSSGRRVRVDAKLPETFLGLQVIDGDVSDMRPYDPAPSVVALRWKSPRSENVTVDKAGVFVVLVDLVPDGEDHYNAIVSKTARSDRDYSDHAPG